MSPQYEIGVVGANRLLCECLTLALATDGRFFLRNDGDAFGEVEDRLRREPGSRVVLIDLSHAREAALELARTIAHDTRVHVLFLGVEPGERHTLGCIEAGCKGMVPIDGTLAVLREAIDTVLRGELAFSREDVAFIHQRLTELSRAQQRRARAESLVLTSRELEILRWVDRGLGNKQIAEELKLSLHTVKNHVHHILEKLGVSHRYDAARVAREQGWIESK